MVVESRTRSVEEAFNFRSARAEEGEAHWPCSLFD